MVELGDRLVERRCWRGAREVEAGHFADRAAPAVAANEVGTTDTLVTGRRRPPDIDAVYVLDEVRDVTLAAYFDPKGVRALDQHGFDSLLIHRVGAPFRLLLRVLANERQSGEMTNEPGPSATHVRSALLGEPRDRG